MKGRSILSLEDLQDGELEQLLDLSARFHAEGIPDACVGRFVCGLFFNPSLRTRTALEIASASLGAHCVTHDVGRGVWNLETRDGAVMDGDRAEHVKDAVGKFLSGVVDCIGVRSFADTSLSFEENRHDSVLRAVAEAARVPVVSLESALFHPMQALADLLVLRNHLQGAPAEHTIALTWAYHPRPLPMAVANSALLGFVRAGYRVNLVHPEGFELDSEVMDHARGRAGDRLRVVHDMDDGLAGAHVIYAKSWGARGEYAGSVEPRPNRDGLRDWIVDGRRQALGNPGAFMHCLPVRRNVVVTDDVIDGPHSWVAEQARSRVLTQAAVLHEVLGS
ncbi:MAG: N-acetylornithine carbamoyltransferase [Planctomycetota bacterium]|jgi:N-acetylornithine carbamoyltransferase